MTISLQKGQTINLEKSQYSLSQVTVGLGWDVREKPSKGLLGRLLSKPQEDDDYDLDAIAFLLDDNGKVKNLGNKLIGGDVIFYNNMQHSSGTIWLTGDNRTGAGDGDDEQIIVKLNSMSSSVHRILFVVQIYQGLQKNQHFGMIENAYIRAVDSRGNEMARYNISGDASFNGKRSMTFAEVYRKGEDWKFRAIGDSHDTDSFVDILKNYVY